MGPAWTTVTVAVAKRVVSSFEVAITVTVAVLGTVAGAVYKPVVSIDPHPGEQVAAVGRIVGARGLRDQPGYVIGNRVGGKRSMKLERRTCSDRGGSRSYRNADSGIQSDRGSAGFFLVGIGSRGDGDCGRRIRNRSGGGVGNSGGLDIGQSALRLRCRERQPKWSEW